MKIWIVSDTHSLHEQLIIPKDIDTIVHCGDSTNYKDWLRNEIEFSPFLEWYSSLPIKNKILIAGNHDTWATKKYNVEKVKELGIHYLEHEYLELEGKIFFGSPYTPVFHDWHFNISRNKLGRYWEDLNDNIDILITHGPPKTILDLAYKNNTDIEFCGDNALLNKVLQKKPKIHCFGHIHNNSNCLNQGIREYDGIKFINASCVTDGEYLKLTSNGIIIDI